MGHAHWTPEILFGHSGRPLHYTGEIQGANVQRILTPGEWDDLGYIKGVFEIAAGSLMCNVLTLIVGSAADWSVQNHTDIDLLASLDNKIKRVEFVIRVGELLRKSNRVPWLDVQHKDSKAFGYTKYFAYMQSGTVFDLSFVGVDSWNNDEVLDFHRNFGLAFCVL